MPSLPVVATRITKSDDEYIVKAYVNATCGAATVRYPDADYFTDDPQDAKDTAKAMIVRAHGPALAAGLCSSPGSVCGACCRFQNHECPSFTL